MASSTTTMVGSSSTASPTISVPATTSVNHSTTDTSAAMAERIDDDLPPAYTPSADPTLGEATIELGPRRPFQEPQHPPSTPASGLASSLPQQNQPQWHQSPGQAYHSSQSQSATWRPQVQQQSAPWQSPSPFGYSRQGGGSGGGGLLGAIFDTVRDVVDVVSGAHEERMVAAQRANTSAYPGSYNSPSGPRQGSCTLSRGPSAPRQTPDQGPATTPHSPTNVPDDGSPTRTPVPGHPLLRGGNLLVYPQSYICVKCRNTGYKNHDPSHPCSKCWDKFGKPYTGALTYVSWSTPSSRMQRPLPKFTPPHVASASSRHLSPPPQHPLSQQRHARSVSQPNLNLQTYSRPTSASYYVRNPILGMGLTPPVPEAIPVSPGDPVLGGRLCMRCEGSGMRPFLILDVKVCEVCGGVGRVWT